MVAVYRVDWDDNAYEASARDLTVRELRKWQKSWHEQKGMAAQEDYLLEYGGVFFDRVTRNGSPIEYDDLPAAVMIPLVREARLFFTYKNPIEAKRISLAADSEANSVQPTPSE